MILKYILIYNKKRYYKIHFIHFLIQYTKILSTDFGTEARIPYYVKKIIAEI